MFLLAWVGLAVANCPEEPTSTVLDSARQIERTYAVLDESGFEANRIGLDDALPCVVTEFSVDDAIVVHRARALVAFIDGDTTASAKSWAAVRALNPSWSPSTTLMPIGSPLFHTWSAAPVEEERFELKMAPDGGWSVDGLRQRSVPRARAFLLQGLDEDGGVVYSGYHYSPAEIPLTDVVDFGVDAQRALVLRRRVRMWGTVTAVVLAGLSVGCFVLAIEAREDFLDLETPPEQFAQLQARANGFGGAGIGLAVASASLFTVSWTARW